MGHEPDSGPDLAVVSDSGPYGPYTVLFVANVVVLDTYISVVAYVMCTIVINNILYIQVFLLYYISRTHLSFSTSLIQSVSTLKRTALL